MATVGIPCRVLHKARRAMSAHSDTTPILLDPDTDFIRNDRWAERIMLGIAQHQLESVFAGRELDTCLGLTRSEMKMGFVLRDRFVGIESFTHVNQQMMVAGVLKVIARMRYAHVAEAEAAPESAFDRCAVLRPYEIEKGSLRGGQHDAESVSRISHVGIVTVAVRGTDILRVILPGAGPDDV